MKYYEWLNSPSMPLANEGLSRVLTEVDESQRGLVLREIGFDANGRIVYRCPDAAETRREFKRGIFDLAPVDTSSPNDLMPETFETHWRANPNQSS
jgi:hypothetical protein